MEFHGTYPLPEASLDRFAVQLSLGYLPEDEERALIMTRSGPPRLEDLRPVCSLEEMAQLQARVQELADELARAEREATDTAEELQRAERHRRTAERHATEAAAARDRALQTLRALEEE